MFQIKKSVLALAAIAATLIAAPQAHAIPMLDVGVMGGMGLSMPSVDGLPAGASVSGGMGFSGGASIGVGPLEVSALYSQYKVEATVAGITASDTSTALDIPALFRVGLGPVSLGLGGFYSLSMDDNSGTGNASDNNNYGATASVRVTIPVVGLFADGRFNLGLKDNQGTTLSSGALYLGFNFL